MVTEYVPVGVRKDMHSAESVIGAFCVLLFMATITVWLLWNGNFYGERMLVHGKEVQATVIGCEYEPGDDENASGWRSVFSYTDEESGKEFKGLGYLWSSKKDADSQIGATIPIVIDVENGRIELGKKSQFDKSYNHKRDLYIAISVTAAFAFSLYLVIYRVIYRRNVNKAICKRIGGVNSTSYLTENLLVTGEVIAAFGLLWYYVKVKYRGNDGKECSRWARSLFTRKEAVFLREKRFIKIAPYKKTFGIVEQMPVKRTVKAK